MNCISYRQQRKTVHSSHSSTLWICSLCSMRIELIFELLGLHISRSQSWMNNWVSPRQEPLRTIRLVLLGQYGEEFRIEPKWKCRRQKWTRIGGGIWNRNKINILKLEMVQVRSIGKLCADSLDIFVCFVILITSNVWHFFIWISNWEKHRNVAQRGCACTEDIVWD